MKNLTEEQVKSLLPRAFEIDLSPGEILFNEGDPISLFFYVEQGKIVEQGTLPDGRPNIARYAGPGEYLGRYATVTGRPSGITAKALETTTLLAIPLRDLQPILFTYANWQNWFFSTDVATKLRSIPLFAKFKDWDLYFLADLVRPIVYHEKQTIYREDAPPEGLYTIDWGQVIETLSPRARPDGDWPRYYAMGNVFGRYNLARPAPRQTTATALADTQVFHIPDQTLKEIQQTRGINLAQELEHINIADLLGQIDLLAGLPEDKRRMLAGYVSLVYHRSGEIVSRQGEPATGLMILADGEAIVRRQVGEGQPRPVSYMKARPDGSKSSVQARWTRIPYFGDHALLADEIRGATVEVTEDSTWIVLQKDDFQRFLDDAKLTAADLQKAEPAVEEAAVVPPSRAERLELPFVTQRHKIMLVVEVLPLVATLIGLLILAAAGAAIIKSEAARISALSIGLGALILLIPWTIWRYANWQNDTLEVTNEVVAHTEKVPFPIPKENRYEAPLAQIQNVNVDISIPGRIFGFGTLSIDTAAARGQVGFTQTPKPRAVQDLIQRAADQARSGREVQFRESIRKNLEEGLFPERLKPEPPESVLAPPEARPSKGSRPPRVRRGRTWVRFEIWEDDRVTWRKHWLNLAQRVGPPLLAAAVTSLLGLTSLVVALNDILKLGLGLPAPLITMGARAWLCLPILVLWVFAALWVNFQYQDWRNDIYIVTDNEVIDVQRDLKFFPLWFLYSESRRQAPLARVQNVNLDIPNLIASVLDFGDVIVQTAGTEGTLDFLFVSNPRQVQAEVLRRLAAYQEHERQREFEDRWGKMGQWFKAYHDLAEAEDED
jgi:CRP-like cAMP-binding protein/membrane protein YdbS with pleckstrin-like domain